MYVCVCVLVSFYTLAYDSSCSPDCAFQPTPKYTNFCTMYTCLCVYVCVWFYSKPTAANSFRRHPYIFIFQSVSQSMKYNRSKWNVYKFLARSFAVNSLIAIQIFCIFFNFQIKSECYFIIHFLACSESFHFVYCVREINFRIYILLRICYCIDAANCDTFL